MSKKAVHTPLRIATTLLLPTVLAAQQPGQTVPQPGQTDKLRNTVKAPPLTIAGKFDFRVVQTFGLRGFGSALISGAIGQANGSPGEWGGGMEGFGRRYGSGLAGILSRQTFAATIETVIREDPRYFPSEDKRRKFRALYAVRQIIYCKTDTGRSSFAYGRVISAFGNGQFVNVWQPASTGSVAAGVRRGFYTLGADAANNFMQEFIRFTRPNSLRRRH